jgi:hypothetical protein
VGEMGLMVLKISYGRKLMLAICRWTVVVYIVWIAIVSRGEQQGNGFLCDAFRRANSKEKGTSG